MLEKRSSKSILDILIIILAVGVVAAFLTPKLRANKAAEEQKICRQRMSELAQAMENYFETAGGKIKPHKTIADSTASEDTVHYRRYYTDNMDELKSFLSDSFVAECPHEAKEFKIIVQDSAFYAIICPNGHGAIVNGTKSWEE